MTGIESGQVAVVRFEPADILTAECAHAASISANRSTADYAEDAEEQPEGPAIRVFRVVRGHDRDRSVKSVGAIPKTNQP